MNLHKILLGGSDEGGWAGRVTRTEEMNVDTVLVETKSPLRKPMFKWEHSIKMELKAVTIN